MGVTSRLTRSQAAKRVSLAEAADDRAEAESAKEATRTTGAPPPSKSQKHGTAKGCDGEGRPPSLPPKRLARLRRGNGKSVGGGSIV